VAEHIKRHQNGPLRASEEEVFPELQTELTDVQGAGELGATITETSSLWGPLCGNCKTKTWDAKPVPPLPDPCALGGKGGICGCRPRYILKGKSLSYPQHLLPLNQIKLRLLA
jgi:hypothetical protein